MNARAGCGTSSSSAVGAVRGAGRLPGKTDAAHSGEGDRPDARSVETAVLSRDALGGERGVLSFMVFQGKFKAPVFVKFLRQSLKQSQGRIYLIVEGHPVHRSGEVRRFVEQNGAVAAYSYAGLLPGIESR